MATLPENEALAMQLGSHIAEFLGRGSGSSAWQLTWSHLWRGGLLALLIIFVLSTQLLFQLHIYEDWPPSDILLGWLDYLLDLLIVGAIVFASVALAALVPVPSITTRYLSLFAAITVGALLGETLLMLRSPLSQELSVGWVLIGKTVRWLVIGGLACLLFVFHRQAATAAAQVDASKFQRIQLDRQITETQLQSLRARIEPHFLVNTLATVQQLYRTEPELGRKVLADFVAYLRAALPQMRRNETTLGQEAALARAYLNVLQVRMGERLRVRFDIPENLAALPFPPFALSTLTENAMKHGLNPLPQGGTLEFVARIENRRLKVSVSDTGAGLRHSRGTGVGLANLRARLAASFGDSGTVELVANSPRGIRATITVPLKSVSLEQW